MSRSESLENRSELTGFRRIAEGLATKRWADIGVSGGVRLIIVGAWALALSIFAATAAGAGEPDTSADAFVRGLTDRAVNVLADPSLDQTAREQQLATLLAEGFDLDKISKLALGRHWKRANAEERKAFRSLFERYVLDTYSRRFGAYTGQVIRVTGWRPLRKDAMVTSIVESGNAEISVDWRVRHGEKGWKILDVVVEGVSMLVTQRNELAAIIERSGGGTSGLLAHMQKVLAKESRTAGQLGSTLSDG